MTEDGLVSAYVQELGAALEGLARNKVLREAAALLHGAVIRGACILVMGNGGSAATADHFAADFEKNAFPNGPRPRITSLCQAAKVLAYGNDLSFERVFAEQLFAQAQAGDVAVMISASGNSPNIAAAQEAAKTLGVAVIGLSGFAGGALARDSDVSLHVPCTSYELAEDAHSAACHLLVMLCKNT